MRVLVATRESQGTREGDLWRDCVEGELVRPVEERCARREESCSCETAFVGIGSRGLTTTATVRDVASLTLGRYAEALGRSLTARERGWVAPARYAEELVRVADAMPPGAVLERWDEWWQLRFDPETGETMPPGPRLADVDPQALDDAEFGAELDGL